LSKQLTANVWDASYYSLAESLFPLLLMIVVLILPYSKITEVAVIVAIIDLIQRSINPIKDVAGKISNIQRAATGISRIDQFIDDLEKGGLSSIEEEAKLEASNEVNFFHLKIDHFEYAMNENDKRKNNFELKNIEIKSSKGDYIGILGHSGSGKSTVLGLASVNISSENLSLELNMKEKSLTWSAGDFKNISSLKSHIGLISQDSHVFSETLAFNITMSTNYDRIKFAKFWEEMTSQFEYLRTWGIEGEDKIDIETISLGQKQIISALRICFQNKPVILFDEISSSLDAGCEEALRGIIKLKQKDSIVWVVTHRVESVIGATKILLMDEGRIVDQGTHQKLLKSSNLYGQFLAELR